jgi:ATP-dependent DNA helicase RecG
VAFANTAGGVLLLGVEDGTKKVTGIGDVLAEEERLASLIVDSISPKVVPSIEVMRFRKMQVLAVPWMACSSEWAQRIGELTHS